MRSGEIRISYDGGRLVLVERDPAMQNKRRHVLERNESAIIERRDGAYRLVRVESKDEEL